MKKLFLLVAAFMVILSGCGKDNEAPVINPGGGEEVKKPEQQKEPEQETVFKNEDIDQAKKMAQQYIAVLTEFHGRRAHTTSDIESLQKEMSEKIKSDISIHKESRIYQESGTKRNEKKTLELSASRFELFLDDVEEVHYPNINASELTIPISYLFPGKYANEEPKMYKLHFVKTSEGEIQIIRDGFVIGGPDLPKKDQEEVDSYDPEKLKNDLQIQ